jgi:predicted RNase H-like nuclease (RuvC/YqgF family)
VTKPGSRDGPTTNRKAGHERGRAHAPAPRNGAQIAPVSNGEAKLARLKDENARLKAELASERGHRKMLEEGLRVLRRQQRGESQSKTAKPPLPPDEARDRRIKALTTENRNLKAKLSIMADRYSDGLATAGGMPFATQSAIAKCLHPDTRNHATVVDKDKAFKGFTSWKADKDKAARKAKG